MWLCPHPPSFTIYIKYYIDFLIMNERNSTTQKNVNMAASANTVLKKQR